jgi:tungstate transport system substrate-binding protein
VRPTAAGLLAVTAALAIVACGDDADSASSGNAADNGRMILATTTSTQDSGLLDELLPRFEKDSGCSVKTIAVGSGEALELGERGDADVLLVHSPEAEEEYMQGGHGTSRKAVMHNDFIVVGPAADPAKINGVSSAAEAFTRIAKAEAPFASRGDESGTHTKELSLWEAAGIEPAGSWYIETGQGMGETLTIASQKQAYTLSDRGTYLATENLDLEPLVEGGKDLLNPYHVIVVKGEDVNRDCAQRFSDWITSPGTQREIGRFGVKQYGEPLFVADAAG